MRAESGEGIAYENKFTGTGIPFGNGEKAYSYQAAVGSVTGGQLALAAAVYKTNITPFPKGNLKNQTN